jgi:glucose-6-phosphate 1-dehydrogenase
MNGPCHFVIFGATGDLARRKLLPAIYQLEQSGRLDPQLRLTALARRDWDTPRWRRHLRASLEDRLGGAFDAECAQRLCERFEYVSGEHADDALYQRLRSAIEQRDEGVCRNVVFYLAIPPDDFDTVVRGLEQAGLNELAAGHRLVIEKPFGMDLEDARRLNARLHQYYDEGQIYRIDHYLGKETVQNLFVFRFANTVIGPLWSRHYVDHVQIIMDESEGIGTRAGYFERTGTLRDMVQSHLLQVPALVAMEPPIFRRGNLDLA